MNRDGYRAIDAAGHEAATGAGAGQCPETTERAGLGELVTRAYGYARGRVSPGIARMRIVRDAFTAAGLDPETVKIGALTSGALHVQGCWPDGEQVRVIVPHPVCECCGAQPQMEVVQLLLGEVPGDTAGLCWDCYRDALALGLVEGVTA